MLSSARLWEWSLQQKMTCGFDLSAWSFVVFNVLCLNCTARSLFLPLNVFIIRFSHRQVQIQSLISSAWKPCVQSDLFLWHFDYCSTSKKKTHIQGSRAVFSVAMTMVTIVRWSIIDVAFGLWIGGALDLFMTDFGERLTEVVLKAAGLEGRTQVDMCVNERGWGEGAGSCGRDF